MSRRAKERLVLGFLGLLTASAGLVLTLVVVGVMVRGAPAVSFEFLTAASSGFGETGGIFYQAAGTLILMTGAGGVCLPVAVGLALFQTECLAPGRITRGLSLSLYALNAVPTILFGLVGYVVFGQLLQTGVSWLTGVLILAVMILPTVQVAAKEAIEAVPVMYRESARALGLSPWQEIRAVVLPQSAWGFATGTLLGLARAAGETAAVMFTATVFSGVDWPRGWRDPVVTLQTHILTLAQEALNPAAVQNAWGAGLVLMALVFGLILASLVLRTRIHMESE